MTPEQENLLRAINRRGKFHTAGLAAIFVWLTALTVAVFGQSSEAWAIAKADRQQFPEAEWGYYYYLSTDHLPDAQQITAARTAAFVVSSFSKAVVLEQHLPTEVQRGLWRIDLRALEWRWQDWHAVLRGYPYTPGRFPPLIVRADYLVALLADNAASDAGYRLLYQGKPPKTLKDFQDFWKIRQGDSRLALFQIEGESGVSLLHIRLLGNEDAADRRTYYFTQDNAARNFNAKTDPLETLTDPNRPHDASEHIVLFPKISQAQGIGGRAQQYLLANGKGQRQDRAPVDIVVDSTNFRGKPEIVNFASCVQCHINGLREPTRNDLRELIESGEEIYADKKSAELVEQQYLADLQFKIDLSRDSEDYVRFVALVTGWAPDENVRAFKSLFENYDAPVTAETAARELYCTSKQLELAFGYASQAGRNLGARLAGIPHGRSVTRAYWESEYHNAYAAVNLWRQATK